MIATKRLLEPRATQAAAAHRLHVERLRARGHRQQQTPTTPLALRHHKLGAENLCAFEANFQVPSPFSHVYGPRQRPDMAYNILIRALMSGEPFTMRRRRATRSNVVADCVTATLLAFEKRDAALGRVFNVGGGEIITLNGAIRILEEITGRKVKIDRKPARPGDQKHTAANIDSISRQLGYKPSTRVADGLRAQVEWQKTLGSR